MNLTEKVKLKRNLLNKNFKLKIKINSSLKSKSFKEIDVFDQISLEKFHTDSGNFNSEKSFKNDSSVLFDVYSEIHEYEDGK